jgi:hypothetical protein
VPVDRFHVAVTVAKQAANYLIGLLSGYEVDHQAVLDGDYLIVQFRVKLPEPIKDQDHERR